VVLSGVRRSAPIKNHAFQKIVSFARVEWQQRDDTKRMTAGTETRHGEA